LVRAVILSKGRGSLALYSGCAEIGLVSYEEIKTFIQPVPGFKHILKHVGCSVFNLFRIFGSRALNSLRRPTSS